MSVSLRYVSYAQRGDLLDVIQRDRFATERRLLHGGIATN